ncbi:MAG: hypothetical protein ACRDD1_04690 [Planctomycetia bacterium]
MIGYWTKSAAAVMIGWAAAGANADDQLAQPRKSIREVAPRPTATPGATIYAPPTYVNPSSPYVAGSASHPTTQRSSFARPSRPTTYYTPGTSYYVSPNSDAADMAKARRDYTGDSPGVGTFGIPRPPFAPIGSRSVFGGPSGVSDRFNVGRPGGFGRRGLHR